MGVLFEAVAMLQGDHELYLSETARDAALYVCNEYRDSVTYMPPTHVEIPMASDGLVPYCRVIVIERKAVAILFQVGFRQQHMTLIPYYFQHLHAAVIGRPAKTRTRAFVPMLPKVAVSRTRWGDAVALVSTPDTADAIPAVLGLLPWHCNPVVARACPGRPGQRHVLRFERIGDVWTMYIVSDWRRYHNTKQLVEDFLFSITNYYHDLPVPVADAAAWNAASWDDDE